MKALTTAGLTKLIQLIKSSFISVDDTVTTTTVTLADVATSGSYNDLTNKPTEIPSQSGQSGKFLTTNGTNVSWGAVDALPTQTSQSGKFLTTNGTSASWANIPEELPSQTSQSGKFLTTNGTTASWATLTAPAWGDITGTLSSQTDLKNALDDKVEYAMVITDYTA